MNKNPFYEFLISKNFDPDAAKDIADDVERSLPEIGVVGCVQQFSHVFEINPEVQKALAETAKKIENPLRFLVDKSYGRLAECLLFANMIGTTTLMRCLHHLTYRSKKADNYITVIYSDHADYSLYFVHYKEEPYGEYLIDGKKYNFAGNGGIIYHSYCQEWSTHT